MRIGSADTRRTGRFPVALVILLVVVAGAAAFFGGRVLLKSDPLDLAREAYQKGDYERSAELARKQLEAKPGDPDGIRAMARALARIGKLDSSLRLYTKVKTETFEVEDSFLFGQILAQTGQYDQAMNVWDQAAAKTSDHPELLDGLARLTATHQRIEEGAHAAEKLAKIPGWEARGLLILGTCRAMMDDWEGAVEALRQGIELDPTAKGAPYTPKQYRKILARCLLRLGNAKEARPHLQAALAEGDDGETAWLESRVDIQEGRFKEAAAAIERSGNYRKDHATQPEPSPYAGSASCGSCHEEICASYKDARHARTFYHGDNLLELPTPDKPLADPQDPKATHTFERDGKELRVLTRVGDSVYKVIVDFAFGTKERYQSMVGRDGKGDYRALRLSHYHDNTGSGWAATSGDVGDADHDSGVRGQEIHVRDGVVRCLGCHVTNPRDFRYPISAAAQSSPSALDTAIGCEGCHGPAANHIAAIKGELADMAIVNVGKASSSSITADCNRCHIVGDPKAIEQDPTNPQWVRSASLTFTFSRCYNESDGALSCLTCHEPHRDANTSPAFYEAKCVSCHSATKATSSASVSASVCKVNATSGCMQCHMPKVPVPMLRTELTDHFIRVRERDPKPSESAASR